MDPSEDRRIFTLEVKLPEYIRFFTFFLCITALTASVCVWSVTADDDGGSIHQGVTIIDAKGVIDVSQIGNIPLGQIPDERISVEVMIANNENSEISGLRIKSFLVRDGREDTISMQLGSDFRDVVLKPGELKVFKNNYAISKQIKPGDYKVMIRVDSNISGKEKDTDYTQFISSQIIKIGAHAQAGGATPVYSPSKIETPGSYLVMRDIDGGTRDAIIKITSPGVTLDGGGHVIRGTPTGYTSGVYVDGGSMIKDIVIKNCIFEGMDFGIWLYRIEGATITNCQFRNCTNIGLRFDQVISSSITDNRFEDNALGAGLFQSSGNTVMNNYFRNQFNAVVNEGKKNTWSMQPAPGVNIAGGPNKGGNVWLDLMGGGFSATTQDQDSDGIADLPYSINGENIDYYPLIAESAVSPVSTPDPDSEIKQEEPDLKEAEEPVADSSEAESTSTPGDEESNGTKETSSPSLPQAASPGIDLVVSGVSSPERACQNSTLPVTITVANNGDMDAGTFFTQVYLSEDSGVTTSDREIGSFRIDGLESMQNLTLSENLSVSSDTPIKYYTIGAIVDPANDLYERNKQNNIGSFNQRIQVSAC